jgi:hypothetical protein
MCIDSRGLPGLPARLGEGDLYKFPGTQGWSWRGEMPQDSGETEQKKC